MTYKNTAGTNQYFTSVEEIYRTRFNAFVALASRHVYNKDLAIDVVHNAMVKTLEYKSKRPKMNVDERIIRFLILKACKKMNKYSVEVPYGDTRDMER